MKNKRNKKLNKNVINWRGRILPTVQQKPTNFSMYNYQIYFSVHISNAALASNTSQSSIFEHDAELAMDGRLDTCSMTQVDNKTWSVDLKPNVRVKGVTITNNKFVNLNQHFKVILEGKPLN